MGSARGNNNYYAGVGGVADRRWDGWRTGAPGCVEGASPCVFLNSISPVHQGEILREGATSNNLHRA